MSALTIAQAVAANVGVARPGSLVANTDPNAVKILQFINEAGKETERRADWGKLEKDYQITGTGTNDEFPLPDDFSRLTTGNAVSVSGNPIRGSLSRDEWFSLPSTVSTDQKPPKYFRLAGDTMSFYPYPKTGLSVTLSYLSNEWCDGGREFQADGDEAFIPEDLIIRGAIWRWRRNIGADFSDYLAEYEAMLEQLAMFDQRERLP